MKFKIVTENFENYSFRPDVKVIRVNNKNVTPYILKLREEKRIVITEVINI